MLSFFYSIRMLQESHINGHYVSVSKCRVVDILTSLCINCDRARQPRTIEAPVSLPARRGTVGGAVASELITSKAGTEPRAAPRSVLLRGKPISIGTARRSDSELLILPALLCLHHHRSTGIRYVQGTSVCTITLAVRSGDPIVMFRCFTTRHGEHSQGMSNPTHTEALAAACTLPGTRHWLG